MVRKWILKRTYESLYADTIIRIDNGAKDLEIVRRFFRFKVYFYSK